MNTREACFEFARLLRAVARGELSPGEALVRRPRLSESDRVPVTWGSAVVRLELEVEHGSDDPDYRQWFGSDLEKLAARLEERAK